MMIGPAEIATLIPHAAPMSLLAGILHWDGDSIRCVASSHRQPANPMRRAGRLHAVCGIEYASQAMAAHGMLAGGIARRPRSGYLVSVRELVCFAAYLDDLADDITIDAEKLSNDEIRVIYGFALGCGGRALLRGRAAVLLDAETA
jgi:predicted hotdog family 3-hydroxylacyl-ACP dehydratase